MPKRKSSSSGPALSKFEKQRKDRLAWCQANVSLDDDIKRYWGKAKDAFASVSDWWNGEGDYEIVSNSLIHGGTKAAMQPLVVSNSRNGGEVRIKFREYIGDVKTHPSTIGAWNNQAYTLNAGNVSTFPWLSTLAANYEQWTPNGIIFEFRSLATEYSTSVNLGSIVMATDYDFSDTAYDTKMEALNSAYASESKFSSDIMMHGIECAPSSNPNRIFFVNQTDTVPSGTSKNEYFLGRFQIATSGGSAPVGSVVGSLYINYDVTLRKPQLYGGVFLKQQLWDSFSLVLPIGSSNPLGSGTPTRSTDSNLGCTVELNKIKFPATLQTGLFKITLHGYYGDAGAPSNQYGPGTATAVNCELVAPEQPMGALLGLNWTNKNGGSNTYYAMIGYCKITASGATLSLGVDGGWTWQAAVLKVEQVSWSQLV
jgi:hypothetical protein